MIIELDTGNMFSFGGSLSWPCKYGRFWKPNHQLFYWDELITKWKAFSIQIDYWNKGNDFDIIGFDVLVRMYSDHAGIRLKFELLGLNIYLEWYDSRHWNGEEGRYMTLYEMEHEFDKPEEKKS